MSKTQHLKHRIEHRVMAEKCLTCRFFVRDSVSQGTTGLGKCRRYPRTIVVKPSSSSSFTGITGGVQIEEHYPTHREGDWCGEYEARSPEPADGKAGADAGGDGGGT